MEIKIIGLGGIGSILCEKICRFVNYSNDLNAKLILIDGDRYEPKNYERQVFGQIGNKAIVKERELKIKFDKTSIDSISKFINNNNIAEFIKNKDVIFLCVDNHKTRKIVSDYCKTLSDVTLISGGNEFTDGNVQIYVRKGGEDLTPDLCSYHPEIDKPDDKLPEEMSCEELAQSDPQLFFTNLGAATFMCWAFYNVVVKRDYRISEVYFDIQSMKSDSKIRTIEKGK